MAAGAIEGIGTIVDILGLGLDIFDLATGNQASQTSDATKTNVRIAVALNGPTPEGGSISDADGRIDVRFFNEHGEDIGSPQVDKYCGSGNTDCEITVTTDDDHTGQQATYGLFTGNDDAICIAYTSVAWADGSNWAWTGDWASGGGACSMGQTWYYSNVQIQNGTNNAYVPTCIWLDANGDQPATAFQVHYPDFFAQGGSLDSAQISSPDQLCGNPSYSVYKSKDPNGITYFNPPRNSSYSQSNTSKVKRASFFAEEANNPANWAKSTPDVPDPDQRDTPASNLTGVVAHADKYTSAPKENRLVTSHHSQHTASDLCNHPYSIGPDFLSMAEMTFCDMHTKTLYPLCPGSSTNGTTSTSNSTNVIEYKRNVDTTKGCFDAQSHNIVRGGPGRLARRQAKNYAEHLIWKPT